MKSALSVTKRRSSSLSEPSSLKSRRVVESEGLRYCRPRLASSPLPSHWVAEPLMKSWMATLATGSRVLKTWSRSTAVIVCSMGILPPSGISVFLRWSAGALGCSSSM
jgi:hypothetical protein